MVKQRENNKTIARTKAKEGCLQCSMTLIKNIRCVEDQGSEFGGDKQLLQENGGMIDDINSSKERTNSPIGHFTIPDNLGLDPPSGILSTTTPAPSKQPYAIDSPVARFEVLERLGYGYVFLAPFHILLSSQPPFHPTNMFACQSTPNTHA
jgi:hypothetical protein